MLTFGLGSGIAGIAGVAIGLFAQVTSEMGQLHRAKSFMTVVVGGVGNIWGTLAGAGMIGGCRRSSSSEPVQHAGRADLHDPLHHPVHPVPARGIIALKGRAAGDVGAWQRTIFLATPR
jgi:urea transport system permease protein